MQPLPGTLDTTSSVDPDEVARFAALADDWWDPNGRFRPLHQFNPVRLAFIRDRLVRHFARDPAALAPLAGLRVLDIGCGGGLVAEPMARLGAEVVEHVVAPEPFIGACARLLAPGGAMIVATLNRTAKTWALAIVGAEYVLGWLPRGTHRWDKFVRPAELAAALRRNGLEIGELTGVGFDPFRREWTLSRDLAVNYMVYARFR